MKQPAMGNFDSVAGFYDRLARLVFGNTLIEAQCHFLNHIPSHSEILILGGGTGELLERIRLVQPTCKVWYIDASAKMISRSKKRVGMQERVTFIRGTENSIPPDLRFDVVVTNFYFDLFDRETLQKVIPTIKAHVKPKSIWLVTDFMKTSSVKDRALLWLMYRFFKITTKIEANDLPDWRAELGVHFSETKAKSFRKGFIRSAVFR